MTTRDEEAFAMTTSESMFALKAILNATWMYSNLANGQGTPDQQMDDDDLRKCNELFEQIVGEAVSNRLADWFMLTRASPEDAHRIAGDSTELLKLAAIIGLTQ